MGGILPATIFALETFFRMFNRYWRTYPWFFQLIQFIILIAVLASFFVLAMTPLVLKWFQVSPESIQAINEHSPMKVIDSAMAIQFLSAVGIFLLPALLFAYFTHPNPKEYLGLRKPGKPIHWLLAPLLVWSATPLFLQIAEWVSLIDFGSAVKQAQDENDRIMKGLLSGTSFLQISISLLVLAILPGVSEELFFRGLLMRFAARGKAKSIWFPLVVSAILFAAMHSNPVGLLSIFLAGLLLGGIYYLTGSLWCGMLAHACYNGFQIVLSYGAKNNHTLQSLQENNHVPIIWVLIGSLLFVLSFYMLWKNRTPLPENWSADFSKEELEQAANHQS